MFRCGVTVGAKFVGRLQDLALARTGNSVVFTQSPSTVVMRKTPLIITTSSSSIGRKTRLIQGLMMMQKRKGVCGILPSRLRSAAAAVVFLSLSTLNLVWGGEGTPLEGPTNFVRIRHDANHQPVSFETATVTYRRPNADGSETRVDLIGVVHIGSKSYYAALNDLFEQYDVLLYELVAPEGTRVPSGGRKSSGADPLSGLQNGMKEMLGLQFQLDHIDYQRDNFVHADMSPEEFVESMSQNDESFAKTFFKMLGSSMAIQGSKNSMDESDLFMAMFSRDREMKMRRAMAKQLSGVDLAMVAFNGKDGSTIINHRNGKCFEILDREIAKGRTNLGVFYGAGHLADMEERLLKKGFKRSGDPLWYVAWPLTREPVETIVPKSTKAYPAKPQTPTPQETPAAEASPSDSLSTTPPAESTDSSEPRSPKCENCPAPKRPRLFRGLFRK